MPLDPQVQTLLDTMAAMGTPLLHMLSIADARKVMDGLVAL